MTNRKEKAEKAYKALLELLEYIPINQHERRDVIRRTAQWINSNFC